MSRSVIKYIKMCIVLYIRFKIIVKEYLEYINDRVKNRKTTAIWKMTIF